MYQKIRPLFTFYLACMLLLGCKRDEYGVQGGYFEQVGSDITRIAFENRLVTTEELNTYTYRNFYNGAGVAIGDINNDGLPDIYFCGNQVDNKLYLNLGNFEFEDITTTAGVACPNVWSTGVNMVDINGDGWLDIYVCKSGPPVGPNRANELFINNQDGTFTEEAEKWGINNEGLSVHAAFFDYDNDGDLDMYLLNNSLRSIGVYDLQEGQRNRRDPEGGNRLYRNDGGKFKDVSESAGIYGSAIGFGLGVTIADLNKDGWLDIYVSNDFFEKDYLYINQRNGTFREMIDDLTNEISMGAMGADIADINNDGWPDIFVTEMLPPTWERIKTKTPFEQWDKYQSNIEQGYFRQFTRNTLQLNTGTLPDGGIHFQEISRYTGTHATDWSWGAIIADFSNSGFKDIFVANGIAKDLTDHDYINFYANSSMEFAKYSKDSTLLTRLIDKMPSSPVPNFFFENRGGLVFKDQSERYGVSMPSFSNGAAYGDLNNDGKLDLVINNIDDKPFIFRNNHPTAGNYLQLKLKGNQGNTSAIGAKVYVYAGGQMIYMEHNPVKGYMSSMDHTMHIGLGNVEMIDTLRITWPNRKITTLSGLSVNQKIALNQMDAIEERLIRISPPSADKKPMFREFSWKNTTKNPHVESEFVDFDRERLAFWMRSNEGPNVAFASFTNGNVIFLPGAKGYSSTLLFENGHVVSTDVFGSHKQAEDVAGIFVDVDLDGDLDLVVASGSNEHAAGQEVWRDRLYLNDGKDRFSYCHDCLPDIRHSTSFVQTEDFNQDGLPDLVMGIREMPFAYGVPCGISLLLNTGDGKFQDATSDWLQDNQFGMVTDGQAVDLDADGLVDLVLAGEWMPVTILKNTGSGFVNATASFGLDQSNGLWFALDVMDINQDGIPDIVAGNHGLNSRFKASVAQPLQMDVNDYDGNGSIEQIILQLENEKAYPVVMLHILLKQLPGLKKQFVKFEHYKDKALEQIFPEDIMAKSIRHKVHTLASTVYISQKVEGKITYQSMQLPPEAQFSPLYAVSLHDVNVDGYPDLITGGNQSRARPEMGVYLGGLLNVFLGDGSGAFEAVSPQETGIFEKGEVRSLTWGTQNGKEILIIGLNNQAVRIFELNK